MFLNILYLLLGVVAVFLVIVALQPSAFRVERSTTIAAPPAVVFALVNDFHKWAVWSPWEKMDPAMERTFAGAPAGTGSTYHWVGNKKVGEGRMTMTDCRPGELIRVKLEFLKPFAATNTTEFTFQPQGGSGNGTQLTWSMTGRKSFLMKAFCLFMNMDKMVGGDFEKGLAQIKTAAETTRPN